MYARLNKEDKSGGKSSLPISVLSARPRAACRSKVVTLFAIFAGFVIVTRAFIPSYSSHASQRLKANRRPVRPESTTSQTKPVVVLPATQSNPEFCRTLFSLLINGYDPPVIINWKDSMETGHYKKIPGMLAWLKERGGDPNDVVLMLDGYDVWAQLPGESVYEQYRNYPFQSSPGVIVGADKRCWPFHTEPCKSLPESPLPQDVYGRRTDKNNKNIPLDVNPAQSKHTNYQYGRFETRRPRYINSGTLLGTSSELNDLFTSMSAKLKLIDDRRLIVRKVGSDQELMALANYDEITAHRPEAVAVDGHLLLFQIVKYSYKDLVLQTLAESASDTNALQIKTLTDLVNKDKQWSNRSLVYNHISHTVPAFLHFAGPEKYIATDAWWKFMWWMQPAFEVVESADQDIVKRPVGKLPAEMFYEKLKHQTSEEDGYGARLPDGTWLSYMDLCRPYTSAILPITR